MNNNTKTINKLSKSRIAALNAIQDIRKNKHYAKEVLNKTLKEHILSGSDKSFASKLTLGVIQTLGTLDEVIYRCVNSPEDIKDNVLDCLRISAYEILYLEKEPHAAVDQGVELVKVVEPRAKGLANLVLRRVVNEKKRFPYGNPDKSIEVFARIYAVPQWLCQLIFNSIGENAGRYLISSSNGAAPIYVFVNLLKITLDDCLILFNDNEAKPHVIKSLCGINLSSTIRIDNPSALQRQQLIKAQQEGFFEIVDVSSQAIVTNAINKLSHINNMLELCAGKGNKTIMFQSIFKHMFGNQICLSVADNNQKKLKILKKRASNFSIKVDNIYVFDATNSLDIKSELDGYKFDFVFIDAPCSGLGTLRRHPEIKWRINQEQINQLSEIDFSILCNASKYVESGGIIAYSTCTVTKDENEKVIENFLKSEIGKEFKLVPFEIDKKQIPYLYTQTFSGNNDTHFSAILKKI